MTKIFSKKCKHKWKITYEKVMWNTGKYYNGIPFQELELWKRKECPLCGKVKEKPFLDI